eukprot:1008908-Pleurochrysis_carterae.AAC.5
MERGSSGATAASAIRNHSVCPPPPLAAKHCHAPPSTAPRPSSRRTTQPRPSRRSTATATTTSSSP